MGRVLKLGILDQEKLLFALRNSATISSRGSSWTFTDVKLHEGSGTSFVFGKLSKFSPEAEVTVVDADAHEEKTLPEPNLRIASSPFIYIPAHSGIAFLRVYNNIEQPTFVKNFCKVVEASHEGFFVRCEIEMVSDLKTFATKLLALDRIFQISANVSPPNPLFSPLWKPLEEYLRMRNADKLKIVEDAPESKGLKTDLPELVEQASKQTDEVPFSPKKEIPVGDAAILMAADGYGTGKVRGSKRGETVVVRTSETAMNFGFDKDPDPFNFHEKVDEIFERIRKSRHMEH